MPANQSAPGWSRSHSSDVCWPRSVNHVKFTEECNEVSEEACFSQKMFINGLNMGLALQA